MMTIAAPPLRPGRYRPGRQKIALAIIIIFVLGVVVAAVVWTIRGASTPHQVPQETHFTKGAPYSEPPVKASMTFPKPKPVGDVAKDTLRTTQGKPTPDPILSAPISGPNQDANVPRFLKEKPPGTQVAAKDEDADGGEDNPLSQSLKRSNLGPKSLARVDKHYLYKIYPGRLIPCNKATYSNSQLVGFVSCEIPVDVYNSENTVKLIPKGSHVFGEYKASVTYGNDRIPVLWTEIQTSDTPRIIVPINSPAADMLGGAGMPGSVDNHVLPALLATAVYTLIEAGPALAQAAIQNNSHTQEQIQFNQFTGPGQSLGGRILSREINRPPTLESNVGRDLTIFVGSEIDFHNAIELRLGRGR
jgi:type IV secretion system protein VirB10